MLPKDKRIDKEIFNEVFKKGSFLRGHFLSFRFLKLNSNEKSRFAVVTPSSVAKKATERSYGRRKGYKVLSDIYSMIKPGFLGIFILNKEGIDQKYDDLRVDIENILKKSGIL
jgi:ribonuclease P protein component